MSKMQRSSQSLRDVLFGEIEALQKNQGDVARALAISQLAKQIINVAKVELDFNRQLVQNADRGQPLSLGNMQLGSLPSEDPKP